MKKRTSWMTVLMAALVLSGCGGEFDSGANLEAKANAGAPPEAGTAVEEPARPATGASPPGGQKAVLITGASSGIGRMTAERLARSGYFVYAGARSETDLAELDAIPNIASVRLDVTRPDEIDAAVQWVGNQGRGLWGVVNNAGVNVEAPLIEADEADLEFLFQVNVYGVFRVTAAFAPLVIESGGRIVNISSISGVLSGAGNGMYSMSKHAIEAYTDSLAAELQPLGVHVAAIEPGNFHTEIGVSRCNRLLENPTAGPYRYFEDHRQQQIRRCRAWLESGAPDASPPPDAVAEAVEHALFDPAPKRHYLVVPNPNEAAWTLTRAAEELLLLNADQPYSYSQEQVMELIRSLWATTGNAPSPDGDGRQ